MHSQGRELLHSQGEGVGFSSFQGEQERGLYSQGEGVGFSGGAEERVVLSGGGVVFSQEGQNLHTRG